MQKQTTPHKHSELIKVWADNPDTKFQASVPDYVGWCDIDTPTWHLDYEYRIRPEPKPDFVAYGFTSYCSRDGFKFKHFGIIKWNGDNLKLTFDGETGKLKSAEVTIK